MTSTDPRSLFALIESELLGAPGAVRPTLTVNVGDRTIRLSPEECRKALYGAERDADLWPVIWRQAVTEAQRETGRNGTKRLFIVWLALPGLYRSLHKILRRLRVERADLEAEAVLAVLTALDSADPASSDTGNHMIKEGVNRMWAYVDRIRREVPFVDIAAFADARNATPPPEEQLRPAGRWELHLTPRPRPEGLATTIRFAESRTRREGERLRALAHSAGLSDLVFRARRHEEADLIGTLTLRPAEARR
ncbi:hypothetical protein [Streptomyces profundus]|uniref:hypothetical protein n=1 Tax=Streptomyces profundus TaxID=2867410 RepID=UPI001D16A3AA|nr:hypothetical protein [Streptomyces sp. MA3_2.13]UED87958.1 hypothetical protein K4G22_30285 [Streptomyces sp. MA3_2.13]